MPEILDAHLRNKPKPKKALPVSKRPSRSPKSSKANRSRGINTALIPAAQLGDMVDPNKPLTEKAKLFAKLWASGESVTSAAIRAGYADSQFAYRLVHYPQVIAIYNKEKAAFEEANQMTRKKVMEGLLEGIELAKLEGTSMGVIAGWREIGRMCGYYEPVRQKVEISITGNVAFDRLNKLSDAELLELITPVAAANPTLLLEGGEEADDS